MRYFVADGAVLSLYLLYIIVANLYCDIRCLRIKPNYNDNLLSDCYTIHMAHFGLP